MSDVAVLHERLLAVERQARVVVETARDGDDEVSVPLAFAMIALRDAVAALDAERDRIRTEARA